MMKTVIVNNYATPYREDLFDAIQAQAECGEVAVIYVSHPEPKRLAIGWRGSAEKPCVYHAGDPVMVLGGSNRRMSLPFATALRLIQLKPNVIVCTLSRDMLLAQLLSLALVRLRGVKLVYWIGDVRGSEQGSWITRIVDKIRIACARRADGMIYYSTKSRDWFADHSLDAQPVTAWIGGQVRHPIGRESNTLELPPRTYVLTRLLTVGGDDPRKGVDQLIFDLSGMPWQSKSQLEVLVAGTSIRGRDRRNGLRVISLGRLDAASMQAAYKRADIALIASNREPWGFVFNEAILAGRPCVVSDHAGAATLAARYGLAYTPGDSASLYRALERARKITPIELSQIAGEISVAKSATSFRAFLRELNMGKMHTIQDY